MTSPSYHIQTSCHRHVPMLWPFLPRFQSSTRASSMPSVRRSAQGSILCSWCTTLTSLWTKPSLAVSQHNPASKARLWAGVADVCCMMGMGSLLCQAATARNCCIASAGHATAHLHALMLCLIRSRKLAVATPLAGKCTPAHGLPSIVGLLHMQSTFPQRPSSAQRTRMCCPWCPAWSQPREGTWPSWASRVCP